MAFEEILVLNPGGKRIKVNKMVSRKRSLAAKKGWRSRKRGGMTRRTRRRRNPGFRRNTFRSLPLVGRFIPSGFPAISGKHIVGAMLGGLAINQVGSFLNISRYSLADLGLSLATTALGSVVLGKFWSKDAAFGFALSGAVVTVLKGIRMILGSRVSLLGGVSDLFGIGDSTIPAEDDIYDIFDEDEASLVGADEIVIPTADF